MVADEGHAIRLLGPLTLEDAELKVPAHLHDTGGNLCWAHGGCQVLRPWEGNSQRLQLSSFDVFRPGPKLAMALA